MSATPRAIKFQQKRNKDIHKMWNDLSSKKINEKQLYSRQAKLEMISAEFYLSPDYVQGLITTTCGTTGEKLAKQKK